MVYEIEDGDIPRLDACEGFHEGRSTEKNAYNRAPLDVLPEGDDQEPMGVVTYVAVRQEKPPLPNGAYMRQIIEGAKFWSLPSDYIEQLEQVEVAT